MSLNLIPPVSSWGDEVSTTLKLAPPIGSPPLNDIYLNPKPDIPLTPKYKIDCLPKGANQNHSFPPICITILTSIPSWSDLTNFIRSFPCFFAQQFLVPDNIYSPGICFKFSRATMSRGHWTWPFSRAIPFETYSVYTGFTHSLHLFLSPFSTCVVR